MTRSTEKKGISFDLPIHHYELLKKRAVTEDTTVSRIIRQLVRDFLEVRVDE